MTYAIEQSLKPKIFRCHRPGVVALVVAKDDEDARKIAGTNSVSQVSDLDLAGILYAVEGLHVSEGESPLWVPFVNRREAEPGKEF